MIETYNLVRFKPICGLLTAKFRVDDWKIYHAVSLVDLDQYKYFWFELVESRSTRTPGVFHVQTTVIKTGGRIFINGFTETQEDVRINNDELADTMTHLGWTHIVKGIDKKWTEHFREGDSLLEHHDGV